MSLINEENICFTTTAMPRAELLEKTYSSFEKNLPWLNFRKIKLFLNIDIFPHFDESLESKIEDVELVAKKYFNDVVVNKPARPSFPQAVKHLFHIVDKEYVMHVEDDWELLCEIPEFITDFFENNNILQVGLRASKNSKHRFVLSPSIMRSCFCKKMSQHLNNRKNPEEQIRHMTEVHAQKYFRYWPYEQDKVVLKDLGRNWMKNTPFARGTDEWTQWRFLPNVLTRTRDQRIQDQNIEIDISKLDGNFRRPDVSDM